MILPAPVFDRPDESFPIGAVAMPPSDVQAPMHVPRRLHSQIVENEIHELLEAAPRLDDATSDRPVHIEHLYSYDLYSYGLYSYGLNSYGLYIVMAYVLMAHVLMTPRRIGQSTSRTYIVMAYIVMVCI